MVETGRVELPSANIPRKASTGVVHVSDLVPSLPMNRRYGTSHPEQSRKIPLFDTKDFTSLIVVATKKYQTSSSVTCPIILGHCPAARQRRRIRNRCWQLLFLPLFTRPAAPRPATPVSSSTSKPMRPHLFLSIQNLISEG